MADIRKSRGVTLEEVARKIGPGMTSQYLSRVEHGKQNVTVDMLQQIADALEVRPEVLLKDNWQEESRLDLDAVEKVRHSFSQLQKCVKELADDIKKL